LPSVIERRIFADEPPPAYGPVVLDEVVFPAPFLIGQVAPGEMGGQCLLEMLGVLEVLRKDDFLGVNSHMLSENLDCTRDQFFSISASG